MIKNIFQCINIIKIFYTLLALLCITNQPEISNAHSIEHTRLLNGSSYSLPQWTHLRKLIQYLRNYHL